jgi:hypothetical protein
LLVLGLLLTLCLLAAVLPLRFTARPDQRLEIWLYAGAILGPLTLAALTFSLYTYRLRARPDLDPKGYYAALEIDPARLRRMPDAEVQQLITRQYRALARRHHPDVAQDSDRMPRLNRAYAELSDPEKRQEYGRGG